ncbi:TPA: ERF family protein [Streptococcus suis]
MTVKESPIFATLCSIQTELVAPKGQYNSFGKYNYRSAEDILEALKPLLKKHDASLVLNDDIEQIGDRYYVRATVTLFACGSSISAQASAREEDTKKGMDGSQITGTASSYARKYALNGLFAIDDNKDPDTDEYANQTGKQAQAQKPAQSKPTSNPKQNQNTSGSVKYITGAQAKKLREDIKNIAEASGGPVNTVGVWFIGQLGVDKIESIPADRLKEAQDLIAKTNKAKGIE